MWGLEVWLRHCCPRQSMQACDHFHARRFIPREKHGKELTGKVEQPVSVPTEPLRPLN
jgi:hypothetical protein